MHLTDLNVAQMPGFLFSIEAPAILKKEKNPVIPLGNWYFLIKHI